MVRTDYYDTREDGVRLYKTYSDEHRYIRQEQTGTVYAEAIDVENSGYTYAETEEYLPFEQEEQEQPVENEE